MNIQRALLSGLLLSHIVTSPLHGKGYTNVLKNPFIFAPLLCCGMMSDVDQWIRNRLSHPHQSRNSQIPPNQNTLNSHKYRDTESRKTNNYSQAVQSKYKRAS